MDQNELNLLSKEHPIVFYDGVCNLCDECVMPGCVMRVMRVMRVMSV